MKELQLDPALYSIETLDEEMKELVQKRSIMQQHIAHQCAYFAIQLARILAPKPLHIGMIGCGFIGSAVLSKLVDMGFPTDRIRLVTRSVTSLATLTVDPRSLGLEWTEDLPTVVNSSDLLFLTVPASQLQTVGRAMRALSSNTIPSPTFLVSTLLGVSIEKVAKVCSIRPSVCVLKTTAIGQATGELEFQSAATEYARLSSNIRQLVTALETFAETAAGLSKEKAKALVGWSVLGHVRPSWIETKATATHHEWDYINRIVQNVFTKNII